MRLFTSSRRSWKRGSETLERCKSFTVFLRASGPVEIDLSTFKFEWLVWPEEPGVCFKVAWVPCEESAGWSELEEGRETSEHDDDEGGWRSRGSKDWEAHFRVVDSACIGFLPFSSGVTGASGKRKMIPD